MEVDSAPLIVSGDGVEVSSDFIAAGGNSDPAAADWDLVSGLIAFGAGCNVALWDPAVCASLASIEEKPQLMNFVRGKATECSISWPAMKVQSLLSSFFTMNPQKQIFC